MNLPFSASSSWREGIPYKGLKNEIKLQHEFLLYNKVPNITCMVENDKSPVVVYGSKEKRRLHFLDVTELSNGSLNFTQLPEIELKYPVISMDWSDDLLFIGSNDRKVHLLRISNIKKIRKNDAGFFAHEKNEKNALDYLPLTDQYTFTNIVHSVRTNPIHKNNFLTIMNNKLYCWDVTREKEPRQTIKGSNLPVLCGEWNPHTGNQIMLSGRSRNLKLLDYRTLRGQDDGDANLVVWARENAHQEAIQSVLWNPFHEHWLASCGNDGMVNVWDLRYSTDPLVSLRGHENIVRSISWSHSHAEFLASGGIDKRIVLYSTRYAPHFQLGCMDKFEDIIVEVVFSKHNRNHLYGVSSSGEFVACKLNSRFLKPLYVSKREEIKEKIVEQLIYCREFGDAFRQLKSIVKEKIKRDEFDQSLDLISLFHPKQPQVHERDPKVKFRKEIELFSYHIPLGYTIEESTLNALEMIQFQSEILKFLEEGKFGKIQNYEDRLIRDIHLFDRNSLRGIVRIYLEQNYQLGMQFVMKVVDILLRMRLNLRERKLDGDSDDDEEEEDDEYEGRSKGKDEENMSIKEMERQVRKKIHAILDLVFMPSIFQKTREQRSSRSEVVEDIENLSEEDYKVLKKELEKEEMEILHGMYRKLDFDGVMQLLKLQQEVMGTLIKKNNAELMVEIIQSTEVQDDFCLKYVVSSSVWICFLNSLLCLGDIPQFFNSINILLTKKVIRKEDDDEFVYLEGSETSGPRGESDKKENKKRRKNEWMLKNTFKKYLFGLMKVGLERLQQEYEFFEFDEDEQAPLDYLENKKQMESIRVVIGIILRLVIIPFPNSLLLIPLKNYLEGVREMLNAVMEDFLDDPDQVPNKHKERIFHAVRPILDEFDDCEENGISNQLTYLCDQIKTKLTDSIDALRINI